jgi:hypothetical protein
MDVHPTKNVSIGIDPSPNMNGGTATKMGTSGKNGRKVWNHHSFQFYFEQLQACKLDHNLPSGNVTGRYWKPWFMDDWLSIL